MWECRTSVRILKAPPPQSPHKHKSLTELIPVCPNVHLPCKAHVHRPPHGVEHWSPHDSSWWHHTAGTCCPEATRFYHTETQNHFVHTNSAVLPSRPWIPLYVALPSGRSLHDGCEKRLGVKEASQPHCRGQQEVRWPGVELPDPGQKVSEPQGQARHGWVSTLGPTVWHRVQENSILEAFHATGHS